MAAWRAHDHGVGMTPAGRWADLRLRIASGLVLAVVGAVTTWVGGSLFLLLVLVLYAVMTWELAGMTALDAGPVRIALAALAALSIWAAMTQLDRPFGLIALMLPPLGLFVTMRADRLLIAAYDAAMMASAAGVILLRHGGALVFLWIVLVVVVTDILGYFAGRAFGGPRFWPAISPKKTWSGTIAGWVGAALVGAAFWLAGYGGPGLILLSPLVALAGQIGDIIESWIKRRANVKDASDLIPGHGGVLDRFDALIGAVLVVVIAAQILPLPIHAVG